MRKVGKVGKVGKIRKVRDTGSRTLAAVFLLASVFLLAASWLLADVHVYRAPFNKLDMDRNPMIVTNVTVDESPSGDKPLEGMLFDLSNTRGLYAAVSNIVSALGGTVTNYPVFAP